MAESALRRIIANPLETPEQKARQVLPTPVNKNFVRRYMMPENFPVINNPDGTVSTHRMASAEVDGRNIAYPTIIQDPATGKLTQLNDDQAFDYALRNNEYLDFPDQRSAQAFAEGGYKSNGMTPPRNMQQERMDARRARIGMEPYVRQAPTQTASREFADMLGGLAIPTSVIPGVGDATGLAADAAMYANYPEERTLGNAAWTLAGLIPLVPGAAAMRAGKEAAEGALDMSQAARMQRADEGKFFKNTLYHGTSTAKSNGDLFDEFKLFEGDDLSRSVSRSPVGKLGVSLAEQPEIAHDFAVRASPASREGAAILPLRFRADRIGEVVLDGTETNDEIYQTVVDSWRQGFDAVRFKNYTTLEGTKGSFFLVKNPEQVRSINAAFDPAKRNSANIMAGAAGAAITGSALRTLVPQEENPPR